MSTLTWGSGIAAILMCTVVLGLAASDGSAAVVALKDFDTVGLGGNLDSVFTGAISGSTITVYTGATRDAPLPNYANTSIGFWYNYGTATTSTTNSSGGSAPSDTILLHFDLSLLPGFGPGAVINSAELRLHAASGNAGSYQPRYVVTQAWSEGNKTGNYPGLNPAAPGASRAHPNGLNSTSNRNADNSVGTINSGSWGVNGNTQWNTDVDTAPVPNAIAKAAVNNFYVWAVTDIVNSWAQGTVVNRGFAMQAYGSINRPYHMSEYGATNANFEPVLFIDYEPVPEPASLALLAMTAPVILLRRRS